jgi:hypothetical protein
MFKVKTIVVDDPLPKGLKMEAATCLVSGAEIHIQNNQLARPVTCTIEIRWECSTVTLILTPSELAAFISLLQRFNSNLLK